MTTQFTVHGLPITQGSKNSYTNKRTGRPILVESRHKELKAWRTRIGLAYRQSQAPQIAGACRVTIDFYLPRPKSHYGTGRNAGKLKNSAPVYVSVKPDIDKLERAVLDALTQCGAIEDDARVAVLVTAKLYAEKKTDVGALIRIESIEQ